MQIESRSGLKPANDLTINAQERLITKYSKDRSEKKAQKAENRATAAKNRAIKPWFFVAGDTNGKTEAEVKAFWTEWWAENEHPLGLLIPPTNCRFSLPTRALPNIGVIY